MSQRDKLNKVYALYKVPKIVKLIETKSITVVARDWGEGNSWRVVIQ